MRFYGIPETLIDDIINDLDEELMKQMESECYDILEQIKHQSHYKLPLYSYEPIIELLRPPTG